MNKVLAILCLMAGIIIPITFAVILLDGSEVNLFTVALAFFIGYFGMKPFAGIATKLWMEED